MTDKTIWKFPLRVDDIIDVDMPTGARILAVQTQHETPCIWALVDPSAPKEIRRFRVFGTGYPIARAERLTYVGTFQVSDGALVFHVFEENAP